MALVLKSVGTNRNLLKFVQYAHFLYSKDEFPFLLREKILPVNSATISQYSLNYSDTINNASEGMLIPKEIDYSNIVKKTDLERMANKIKRTKITYANSLRYLKLCANLGLYEPPHVKMKLTKVMWNSLKSSGIQFDIFHYNILLDLYLQNEYKFSSKKFLALLEEKGLSPNLVTYRRLLRASCQQGNLQEATFLLEKIQENDLPINEYVFDSLIHGYCKIDDIDSALGVLKLMESKNLQPSSEAYTKIMCFYGRKGKVQEIKNILNICDNEELMFTDYQYLEVIASLVVSGQDIPIDFIYDRILKTPKFFYYKIQIINRLLFRRMDEAALNFYRKTFEEDVNSNSIIFKHFFMESYFRLRTLEEVAKFCVSLVPPGEFNHLFALVLKKIILKNCMTSFQNFIFLIREFNFPIRPHYFWPFIIKASEKGNNGILKVLQVMKELKVHPCSDTLKVVVDHYNFKNIKQDLGVLKNLGLNNQHFFGKLLLKFINKEDYEKAKLLTSLETFVHNSPFLISVVDEKNVNHVTEILYHYFHDIYIDILSRKYENSEENALRKCVGFLQSFINLIVTEKPCLITPFLQALSNQPVSITNQTACFLKSKFHYNNRIVKLADRLLSNRPEDTMEGSIILDKKILKNKLLSKMEVGYEFHEADETTKISEVEKNLEIEKNKVSVGNILALTDFYVTKNKIEEAMESLRKLKSVNENFISKIKPSTKRKFFAIVKNLLNVENEEAVKEAFEIGQNLNLITKEYFDFLILEFHIERNEIEKAVDLYCKATKKYKKYYYQILKTLTSTTDSNYNLINKVINSKIRDKSKKKKELVKIFFQFVNDGCSKQAENFMGTMNFSIFPRNAQKYCQEFSKDNNKNALLCLLENFNIGCAAYYLEKLYLKENKPEEIERLRLLVQEKNITVDHNIGKIESNYLNEKEDFLLKNKKENVSKKKQKKELGFQTEPEPEPEQNEHLVQDEVTDEIMNLIEGKKFSELFTKFSKTKARKLLKACIILLHQNKTKEYLEILEKVSIIKPEKTDLILTKIISTKLEPSESKEVMKIATNLLRKGYYKCVKRLLTFCLQTPQLIKIFHNDFKILLDENLCSEIIQYDTLEVQRFLHMKDFDHESRALVFSILIQSQIDKDIVLASKFVKHASDEGFGQLLHVDTLKLLNKKLS